MSKWTCSHCNAINPNGAFKCHNCPNVCGDEYWYQSDASGRKRYEQSVENHFSDIANGRDEPKHPQFHNSSKNGNSDSETQTNEEILERIKNAEENYDKLPKVPTKLDQSEKLSERTPRVWVTKRHDGGLTHIALFEQYADTPSEPYISVTEHEAIVAELKAEIKNMEEAVVEWQNAAQSWMSDYDALKNKYEPMIVVTSNTENKDLQSRLAVAEKALEKIADPRKRDHKEPDAYTQLGCVMNIANEALAKIGGNK